MTGKETIIMSSKTLLRSSYLLPAADQTLIEDGAVVWEEGTILEVGQYNDLLSRYPKVNAIEYKNHLALPGLVNAHDHGTGVSYPQMGIPDEPLETWLPKLVSASYADPYLAALYQGISLLSHGVTTTMHQHDPRDWNMLENELLETARGYRDAGIRATISLSIANQNQLAYIGDKTFIDSLPHNLATQIKESKMGEIPLSTNDFLEIGARLQQKWASDSQICFAWGPYGPQWCSDELLQVVHDAADGAPIQIHLLETRYQKTYAERTYGGTTLGHLQNLNLLTPNVSFAHSIWLKPEEIEILGSTKSAVVHCPSSNLRIRSGISPVLELIDAGVAVGIGLDGVGLNDDQDMFLEMRLAGGLAFEPGFDGRYLTSQQLLKMATQIGAKILGHPSTGSLEPGAKADLLTIRLDNIRQPFLDERVDLVNIVLLRAQQRDVDTVVVAGEVLVRNGSQVKYDVEELASKINKWSSTQDDDNRRKNEKLINQLLPYLRDVYKDW
jgi:cytosine/adenosine deaminase-related metal-dependent hydrolase